MKDLRRISQEVISQILPSEPTKADRTKLAIVDAAIKNYVTVGIDLATFERIAQTSGLSRPLVQRYFPERNDIFELSIKYIRANFQNLAVQAIQKHKGPVKQLEAYVETTFKWIDEYRDHARVWLLFFYYCSIKPEYRKTHSELTEMGQKRIEALIENGKKEGVFKSNNPSYSAKLIQAVITGTLATIVTENLNIDIGKFKKLVSDECLRIVGH